MSRSAPTPAEKAALRFACPTCSAYPAGWCATSGRYHTNLMKRLHATRLEQGAVPPAPSPPTKYNPQRPGDHPLAKFKP